MRVQFITGHKISPIYDDHRHFFFTSRGEEIVSARLVPVLVKESGYIRIGTGTGCKVQITILR